MQSYQSTREELTRKVQIKPHKRSSLFSRKYKCQFHLSEAAMILNFDQGHWNWYERVKLSRDYCHAKIERSYLNGVQERANNNFVSREEARQLSPFDAY